MMAITKAKIAAAQKSSRRADTEIMSFELSSAEPGDN
jgi:hypothetical protein